VSAADPFPLRVDIVSDVVCPWCIIGYKQFEKALRGCDHSFDVQITWRPFELNPHMPPGGQDLGEHIQQKYGSSEAQRRGARDRLTGIGASLGFHFDYFDEMRVVNTFRAHRLLHWAALEGKQTELKLALFAAFFSKRRDVNDTGTLLAICEDIGLSRSEAEEILGSERYANAVRAEQREWLEREIHAVPFFVFNNRFSVPGAQEAETFVKVLNKLVEKSSAKTAATKQ
jgi:predicted DsbA family dithiol-disulfide isomerase